MRLSSFNKLTTQSEQIEKLFEIVSHNLKVTHNLIDYVISLPKPLQMVRIGSELLPLYAYEPAAWIYQSHDVKSYIQSSLASLGEKVREHNLRVSMHPGQFVILNSPKEDLVVRSIAEIEYHADIMDMMGLADSFHPYGVAVNIHLGCKEGGAELFRKNFHRLSEKARNVLTIENDEFSNGLDEVLKIADLCPIVLDVHHHWIATGEYIEPNDRRVEQVLASWRGIRPKLHYSVSRDELSYKAYQTIINIDEAFVGMPYDAAKDIPQEAIYNVQKGNEIGIEKPSLNKLLARGLKRAKLRGHSDFYNNTACNKWALSFIDNFDIMCESKQKNIASWQLYECYLSLIGNMPDYPKYHTYLPDGNTGEYIK